MKFAVCYVHEGTKIEIIKEAKAKRKVDEENFHSPFSRAAQAWGFIAIAFGVSWFCIDEFTHRMGT